MNNNDNFFNYLVATDTLDKFLGKVEDKKHSTNNKRNNEKLKDNKKEKSKNLNEKKIKKHSVK